MDKVSIGLIGRLRVTDAAGKAVAVSGRKPQALLAYLALHAGRPQPRAKLAALLWGDRFDEQARQSLRQGVSRLRKAFAGLEPSLLVTDAEDVTLRADAVDVDAHVVEGLAADGSADALTRAADLCSAPLLDGMDVREAAFDEWLAAERHRFLDLSCAVLEKHAESQAGGGAVDGAIETAQRLVALDPLREAAHRLLMRLYAQSERRAAALKQYRTCAEILRRDLGTEPDSATTRLFEGIEAHGKASSAAGGTPDYADAGEPTPTDKPSVAVLPLTNLSGDPEQEYFADGITEDIITALSRNRWLSVVARNSTYAYKGRSVDVRHIASELGVDYVVEGSVRKAGDRVRIAAQLIDAASGNHIWAERYDRDLDDMFAVQDEITDTVAGSIEPELGAAESQRARRKATESLDAWDCYHLGLSHMYKFNETGNAEAQRLFRKALEIDPDFGAAHARLAYAMVISTVYFDADPTATFLDDALHVAQRAAALDDQNALAHFAVGRAHLVRREYNRAVAEFETAVELNPALAQAHCGLGDALAYAGRLEESISRFEEAVRLSPHDPYRWGFLMYGSLAHLFLKHHETAAEWAEKAVQVPNSHYWANAALVAALGHLDRRDETRAAVAELRRRKPEFTCRFAKDHLFYLTSPAQVDHYLEGLRKAGVPE
jgi:TolB-like protein